MKNKFFTRQVCVCALLVTNLEMRKSSAERRRIMALSNLSEWNEKAETVSSACGTACGSGDNNASGGSMEEKPAACGSACGAGDK